MGCGLVGKFLTGFHASIPLNLRGAYLLLHFFFNAK
jgi:hypothetical protein